MTPRTHPNCAANTNTTQQHETGEQRASGQKQERGAEKTKKSKKYSAVMCAIKRRMCGVQTDLLIELDELALVDGSDTQLTLNCRDERRALVHGAGQLLQSLLNALRILDGTVQTQNAHVLLSGGLLRLEGTEQERRANANSDQIPLLVSEHRLLFARGIIHIFSLACVLCCRLTLTNRVARSMHTSKLPVTFGSSVPECPVFSTRRMRRIQATTS